MELYEAIRTRRSVRAYEDRPIPEDVLMRVMEAARLAPSARNLQPWKFILVTDPELRRQVAEAANGQMFIATAPVIIAGVALEPAHVMSCEVPAYAVNLGIAMEHIALAAAAEGLGTCWIGAFSQSKVKEILKVPEPYKIVELMPLGYPKEGSAMTRRPRKSLDEIICYDTFK
ncbi:MAG TPA: nitroreductase [Firmicutes bacterium]|nr:nitroreductase [Bacillota bacterium]